MIRNSAPALCVLLTLISCGNSKYSQVHGNPESFADIQKEVINILLDTATTADRLTKVMTRYEDCLKVAATNPDNIDMRVDAQERSMFTMMLLLEKFAEMDSLGRTVSPAQKDTCLRRLIDVTNLWHYAEQKTGPVIFRELFYYSYQHAEEPVPGYFQIYVHLPTKKHPEPSVEIYYPQTADSDPLIAFTKDEVAGAPAAEWENVEFVRANALQKKNANGNGAPMNDFFGPDLLEKMLVNDHMYLIFYSESPSPGILGDREIARMDLRPFQEKYNEVTK